MNKRKIIGYIGTIIIGIGFIMMALGDALHSEIASFLQAMSGTIFIVVGIKKIASERKGGN